jgi:hypothetical protein
VLRVLQATSGRGTRIGDDGDCSGRRVACIANFIRRQRGWHNSLGGKKTEKMKTIDTDQASSYDERPKSPTCNAKEIHFQICIF